MSHEQQHVHDFVWYCGDYFLSNSRLQSTMVAVVCSCCHVIHILHYWARPWYWESYWYDSIHVSIMRVSSASFIRNLT